MQKCLPINFVTPKKFLLNGLLFGEQKSKTVFIFIHGLCGTIFSQINLVSELAKVGGAALTFNNRGSGIISKVKQLDIKNKKGYLSHIIGGAHENFTDCVDDIQGAIGFCVSKGFKKIFLVGHSTGCQKIVYYLSRIKNKNILGAVLLAPVSDYASAIKFTEKKVFNYALKKANFLFNTGKKNELLPTSIWPFPLDAARFLGLHTPDSAEEIFTYATSRKPKTLQNVKIPLLVFWAGADEYADRPATEVLRWFKKYLKKEDKIILLKESLHSFYGFERKVVQSIMKWLK